MMLRVTIFAAVLLAAGTQTAPPQSPPPTIAAAQARLQAGDAAGAVAILQQVTKTEPANARAFRLLGTALQQTKAYEAAVAAFSTALSLNPADPVAGYNMAAALALAGQPDKAIDALLQARARRFDTSQAAIDPAFAAIRKDARFISALPTAKDFVDSFVEPVQVLAEWRGEAPNDQFGWIARSLGDVDGDRASDVVTSAPTKTIGSGGPAGRVYVYSSKSRALLWKADGEPGDQLGMGLAEAGDVNKDGIPDVIASAPGRGRVRVYSGRDGRVIHTFTGRGAAEQFGAHVAGGDVNGDGYSDAIIGAPGRGAGSPDPGRAVAYSGRDGSILVEWTGERAGDAFGSTLAGDPLGTSRLVIVGAPGAGPRRSGRAYVYGGAATAPKFMIESDETGGALGAMFSAIAGDVDGDGTFDVYVSDWANAANGPSSGRVYVHSGHDGRRLHAWTGERAGDGLGTSPSKAGDVDGDGHADFIVGAWQESSGAPGGGRAYLYSGKTGARIKIFTNKVPGDTFGFDAVGIGDVDGDGTVDLPITSGWSAVSGYHSGRVFIVSSGIRTQPGFRVPGSGFWFRGSGVLGSGFSVRGSGSREPEPRTGTPNRNQEPRT